MVAQNGLRAESLRQNLQDKPVAREETFLQTFLICHVKHFRYQLFLAVSEKHGGKVPVVDYVLSSHEQEIYPTTSLDENSMDFEFQTDRNYYVDLRRMYLAGKLKFFRGRGYETYKTKEVKKDNKEQAEADEEMVAVVENKNQDPFHLVIHVNNILHSISSFVQVHRNYQQIDNSNGFYGHKSYFSNKFKGAISEHKEVLHCAAKGTIMKKFWMNLWKHLCLNYFSQGEQKCLVDSMAPYFLVIWKLNSSAILSR